MVKVSTSPTRERWLGSEGAVLDSVDDRIDSYPSELTVPDASRVLVVLLREYGPLCERCLAYHARMTISRVADMLDSLRQHVALRVEHCECPGCQQFTQAFSLAKTHDDAEGDPG